MVRVDIDHWKGADKGTIGKSDRNTWSATDWGTCSFKSDRSSYGFADVTVF